MYSGKTNPAYNFLTVVKVDVFGADPKTAFKKSIFQPTVKDGKENVIDSNAAQCRGPEDLKYSKKSTKKSLNDRATDGILHWRVVKW